MNKNNVWFITAKTNLHIGNENTSSYGLIDLAIQRNVTTDLPCINSSSLKGALNEYAAQGAKIESDNLIKIFGCDKVKQNGSSRNGKTQKGNYIFFDANILFLPVQDDKTLYHLETSHDVIKRFRDQMSLFGIQLNNNDEQLIDELKSAMGITKDIKFSDSDEAFIDLCSDDNLPIIARNILDNGESKNLWYEQVLPAETILYTLIDDKGDETLRTELNKNDTIVQIGAGATIGYGYCKFTELK